MMEQILLGGWMKHTVLPINALEFLGNCSLDPSTCMTNSVTPGKQVRKTESMTCVPKTKSVNHFTIILFPVAPPPPPTHTH